MRVADPLTAKIERHTGLGFLGEGATTHSVHGLENDDAVWGGGNPRKNRGRANSATTRCAGNTLVARFSRARVRRLRAQRQPNQGGSRGKPRQPCTDNNDINLTLG